MDGTLLDDDYSLHPRFFQLFEQIQHHGIMFAAASGRQYHSLISFFEPIKDDMLFIAENGTLVMHKGEELYSCGLDFDTVLEVICLARTMPGAHLVLNGKKQSYIETRDQVAEKTIRKFCFDCHWVDDLTKIKDDIVKVSVCHFNGVKEHLLPTFKQSFLNHQVVVSGHIWLDVMNIKASKGEAIRFLQTHLDFSFEQTMSFGDNYNDIDMFKASYHSYAVENAELEIKQYARFLAPANTDNGVIDTIQSYLNSLK